MKFITRLFQQSSSRKKRPTWSLTELEPRVMLAGDAAPAIASLPATSDAPAASEASVVSIEASSAEHLVLVDSSIADDTSWFGAVPEGADFAVLSGGQDPVAQIDSILKDRTGLKSVHLISHGQDGVLQLGNLQVTEQVLRERAGQISNWGNAFADGGDLLLYGCNVAETEHGQSFLRRLAEITGVDVAASTDRTGSESKSIGDWDLEWHHGDVNHSQLLAVEALNRYHGHLAIDLTTMHRNGAATIEDDELQLTGIGKRQAGSAFLDPPIDVDSDTSFQSAFSFRIDGGSESAGADGMTFLLQNSPAGANAIGRAGGFLGYDNLTNSLAIEFDTYRNGSDSDENTIAVVINGDTRNALVEAPANFDLNDGTQYHAWVEYNGDSDVLEVFLSDAPDKPADASLIIRIELDQIVGDSALVGFSAGNYDLPNYHRVSSWSFSTDPPPPNPGRFALATSQIATLEGQGAIALEVERLGGTLGAVSIDYQIVGDSAVAGEDFVDQSGRLFFADGQRSKQLTIDISDDDDLEKTEEFSVQISNPLGGAGLLTPETTHVTVFDDDAGNPVFLSFESAFGLNMNGSASIEGDQLQLTGTGVRQAGTAFFESPIAIDSSTSFQSAFSFEIGGGRGSAGADGMTFLLQGSPDRVDALGREGGFLGYDNITNSVAIEFDTFRNAGDGAVNTIAVVINGDTKNALIETPLQFDLNDGTQYYAWVDYTGTSDLLEVYLSDSTMKPLVATLTTEIELDQIVGEFGFAGFSAANYYQPNYHRVSSWTFSNEPPAPRPGSFSLVTSQITASEGQGEITLEVRRLGGSAGAASLDYRVDHDSAMAGQDYVDQSGRLLFADGETSKQFTIQLIDDDDAEPTEEFSVKVDNAIGSDLLLPRTSLVTILDDDSGFPIYPSFDSAFGLSLNGSAALEDDQLLLTSTDVRQAGTAFFDSPIAIDGSTSFQSAFSFQIDGGSGTIGADGMTFLLQNSPAGAAALGQAGGFLGYDNITSSLAIEFDTYKNAGDDAANTLAVVIDGDTKNALIEAPALFDLNNGTQYYAWVDYNGDSDVLAVFLSDSPDKPLFALLKTQIELDQIVGNSAFAGFSAGNFDLANSHHLSSWTFSLDVPPVDPPLNPTGKIVEQDIYTGLVQPLAVDWSPDGRNIYIGEKGGIVKVARDGSPSPSVLIDISAQVNNVQDRGLLDIALHPDFENNGYMYILYTYDPPEVFDNVGHPNAGPNGRGNRAGRLMRVTLDTSTGFTTMVAGSETLLLGTNSTWDNFNAFVDSTINMREPPAGGDSATGFLRDFINSDSRSHTVGSLAFGTDGYLFVSLGDGGAIGQVDVRALRVQDVDSLAGKVLRIDSLTGQGLSDNPFFDGDPDSNRSKVYQLGLRNPWRLTVDPFTGQLLIGDTGLSSFEEINSGGPGENFGWPFYEGGQGRNVRTPGYSELGAAQDFYRNGTATPAEIAMQHQAGSDAVALGDVLYNGDLGFQYEGDVFYNDIYRGVVRHANIDATGHLFGVEIFVTGAAFVVDIQQGPDGSLYYVNLFQGTVGKWQIA